MSKFSASDEGWVVTGPDPTSHFGSQDLTTSEVFWDKINEDQFGSIRVRTDEFPTTWLSAPDIYLGDQSVEYGGSLKYDTYVRYADPAPLFPAALEGADRTLIYLGSAPELNSWQSVEIPLTADGWVVDNWETGRAATEDDMMSVLGDLRGLYILSDWRVGQDDTNVDNVQFGRPTNIVDLTTPDRTYLRAADEEEPGPLITGMFELATVIPGYPIKAFDWVELQRLGDFGMSDLDSCGDLPASERGPFGDCTGRGMNAIFSGSDTLLADPTAITGQKTEAIAPDDPDYSRVPDAVAPLDGDIEYAVTPDDPFNGGASQQPSDIPEDFRVDQNGARLIAGEPVRIQVPEGATHLFFGGDDVQWYDNVVTDDVVRFGIRITLDSSADVVLAGDYNLNGAVDAPDYNVFRDNFGSTTELMADGNGDGTVNAADYNVWRDNFGNVAGAAVPEPTTLCLSLLTLLASAASIRKR